MKLKRTKNIFEIVDLAPGVIAAELPSGLIGLNRAALPMISDLFHDEKTGKFDDIATLKTVTAFYLAQGRTY